MAQAHIDSGICGFTTHVETTQREDYKVGIKIESECPDIQKLASDGDIDEVDALQEISFRRGMPEILARGHEYCAHAGCPVPAGIVKAVEVEAGLALPKDVKIEIEK